MQKVIYAVYKGEEFICEGTSRECANYLGVKMETIRWWKSPANCKRALGKNRRMAIVIEED